MICTRKEFIDLCGISNANYSTYVKRGKIIPIFEDGTEFVDTDNPANNDFFKKRKEIVIDKITQEASQTVDAAQVNNAPSKTSSRIKKVKKQSHPKNDEQESSGPSRYLLELEKLQIEIRQKEVATALNEQKLSTLKGDNIPASMVNEMFGVLSRSLLKGYGDLIENEISSFCAKQKLSKEIRVGFITKLIKGLNSTHEKSVNEARANYKQSIKNNAVTEAMEDDGDE